MTIAKWTFMVYMAADNDLSAAGAMDMQEMRASGLTDQINVLTEYDSFGDKQTHRFHVKKDGIDESTIGLGETDSGDPETLFEFVCWAVKHYPAERYCLVLWNHGGGWAPTELDRIAQDANSPNYSVRESTERSASSITRCLFRSSVRNILSKPTPQSRAICSDDGSGHSLDTVELRRVLDRCVDMIGRPIDVLGMDACLMSNLEVAYEIKELALYLVASEENEPGDGWPYKQVLSAISKNPLMSSADFAKHIVDVYIRSYTDRNFQGDITQAALDLGRISSLAKKVNMLGDAVSTHMPGAAPHVWHAHRKSPRFHRNTLLDIKEFAQNMYDLSSAEQVRSSAESLLKEFANKVDSAIIAEGRSGAKVSACGGLSVYLTSPLTGISPYYRDLLFAKDHGWSQMLREYHDA